MEKIITDALIVGDLFSGIAVCEYDTATYKFELEGHKCTLKRTLVKDTDERKVIDFDFVLEKPAAFRLDVLIPEDCKNAHIGLNGKELVGFFDKNFDVKDPEPFIKGSCNDPHKVSTLHPGEFQALYFKWENGDKITFAFYY